MQEEEQQATWRKIHQRIQSPILDDFPYKNLDPKDFDRLMADGWWDYGSYCCRHNFIILEQNVQGIYPLRVRLSHFSLAHSRSLRKIARRAERFRFTISEPIITPEKEAIYAEHRSRISPPHMDTLAEYLAPYQITKYKRLKEISLYADQQLVACSYINVGKNSAASLYCLFKEKYQKYSLGFLTMLLEIAYCIRQGMQYYYPGYCCDVPSRFDYKRRLPAIEYYDWDFEGWLQQPKGWMKFLGYDDNPLPGDETSD